VAAGMNGRRNQIPYFKAEVTYARNAEDLKAWWVMSISPAGKDSGSFGNSCGRGNIGETFGIGLLKDIHGRNGNRKTHLKERMWFSSSGRRRGIYSIKGRLDEACDQRFLLKEPRRILPPLLKSESSLEESGFLFFIVSMFI
jgi:hypothetical protein